jgi:hypothetical protein
MSEVDIILGTKEHNMTHFQLNIRTRKDEFVLIHVALHCLKKTPNKKLYDSTLRISVFRCKNTEKNILRWI